tara:strand:+ start:793 stop:1080 length:288 start_codon:yes stop_codon:yes gene_type:complete
MVKPKTKKQKDQDRKLLEKTALKCGNVLSDFIKELSSWEFKIDHISIGDINKMQRVCERFNEARSRKNEEYTLTSYQKDYSNKEYNNATHINHYK